MSGRGGRGVHESRGLIHDLIHRQWRTRVSLHTDARGVVKFDGFCGQYQVRLGGRVPHSVNFHLPGNSRGSSKFDLVAPA
jgi:hypothetical protein